MITMYNVKRIMIIGQPGSGKSTLARTMGSELNLPVFHIDHIHWKSGWVERTTSEKNRLCSEVHAKEEWIFEGGRSPTWPERLDRADVLVWLDLPLALRAWRVFWRTVRNRQQSPPDLPQGCQERFNWEFTKWIWTSRNTSRDAMQRLYDSAIAEKQVCRFRTRADVSSFVDRLRKNSKSAGD